MTGTHLMRRSAAGVATAAMLALATLTGCSGDSNTDATPTGTTSPSASATPSKPPPKSRLARYYSQQLKWSTCNGNFECSKLLVPLDYSKPKGDTIRVAVVRLPASGRRMGAVVVNPGGPGASGVQYALAATRILPSAVREQFDVVGFDPRGVGDSEPIRCVPGSVLDAYLATDATPDSPAERKEIRGMARAVTEGCARQAGRLLPHVGTIDAARDMDVLRAALGDAKLTYVGKSYGTFLGALYANLFPKRVRALILDGAVDPAQTGQDADRAQAQGFETALTAFLHDCVDHGCPLGSSYDAALQRLEQLAADADAHPLPANLAPGADGRQVNESRFWLGVAAALYSRGAGWAGLRAGLARAMEGDGSVLLQLGDGLWDRQADGTYSTLLEANTAINCIDREQPRNVAYYEHDAAEFAKESPHFGAFIGYGLLSCATWPVSIVTKSEPLPARGAAPILVIGTTRDPATPYQQAVALAKELDSGVLLKYNGDGHTVYGTGASSCVDKIGNDYLINLRVPKAATTC